MFLRRVHFRAVPLPIVSRRGCSTAAGAAASDDGGAGQGDAPGRAANRLRPIQWAKLDPVEKLTCITDCTKAVDTLFDDGVGVRSDANAATGPTEKTVFPLTVAERDTFFISPAFTSPEALKFRGSPALATWLAVHMTMWLRVLADVQDVTTRNKNPHAETQPEGWGMSADVLPTKNIERLVDVTVSGRLFLTDRGAQFDNRDGKHVELVTIRSRDFNCTQGTEVADADMRVILMAAFAAIATQVFVYGNAVKLTTDDASVAAVMRHAFAHLIRFYDAVQVDVVDEAALGAEPSYVSPALLAETWVMLGDDSTWSLWRVPFLVKRVAKYLAESRPRVVMVDSAWAGFPQFKAAVEAHLGGSDSALAQRITWMPVVNLESDWGNMVTTHCVSVFATGAQQRKKVFRDAIQGRTAPAAWRQEKEDLTRPTKTTKGHRSRLGMAVASDHARRALTPEDRAALRVIGINTSALDALFTYPQLELSPGRVGNALRFSTAMRSIVRRPFGSANLFAALGGTVELGSETSTSSRNVLRQERCAQVLQRTLPLSVLQYAIARWFGV